MLKTYVQNLGRFEIVEEIGRGGCGVVYKALDPKIGRHVAIKTILPDGSPSSSPRTTPRTGPRSAEDTRTIQDSRSTSLYQRLLLEARSAGRMSHPNIVVIHELDEQDGVTFIVMEYVAGRTLGALMGDGPLDLEIVASILRQAAEGMDYAHENGIVHRDIKPANMLITPQNFVKITDFGIAKVLMSDVALTRTGTPMGTAFYMAPEQIAGQPVSAKTDQWALGIIAFELLAGRKPFSGDSWPTVLHQILNVEPPPIASLRSDLPADADEILRRVLAKDGPNRFSSCTDFVRALQSSLLPGAAFTQTVPARTVTVAAPVAIPQEASGPAAPPPRRKWWLPVAAGAALAAIAGTAVWLRAVRPDAQAPPPSIVASPAPATPPPPTPTPVTAPAVAETAKQPVEPPRDAAPPPAKQPEKAPEKAPEVKAAELPPESSPPAVVAPPVAAANLPPPPVVQPKPRVIQAPPAKPVPIGPPPDERAWAEIANSKSAAAFEQFRREYPNSPRAREAADRLAQIEAERKAAEAAALARQNRQLAEAALQKYRQAFERRNLDELRRVWPSLNAQDQASFRDFFRLARAVTMTLRPQGEPEVSGDTVTVRAIRSIQMTSERGREPAQDNPVVIRLKRSGQEMLIESVTLAR